MKRLIAILILVISVFPLWAADSYQVLIRMNVPDTTDVSRQTHNARKEKALSLHDQMGQIHVSNRK